MPRKTTLTTSPRIGPLVMVAAPLFGRMDMAMDQPLWNTGFLEIWLTFKPRLYTSLAWNPTALGPVVSLSRCRQADICQTFLLALNQANSWSFASGCDLVIITVALWSGPNNGNLPGIDESVQLVGWWVGGKKLTGDYSNPSGGWVRHSLVFFGGSLTRKKQNRGRQSEWNNGHIFESNDFLCVFPLTFRPTHKTTSRSWFVWRICEYPVTHFRIYWWILDMNRLYQLLLTTKSSFIIMNPSHHSFPPIPFSHH